MDTFGAGGPHSEPIESVRLVVIGTDLFRGPLSTTVGRISMTTEAFGIIFRVDSESEVKIVKRIFKRNLRTKIPPITTSRN